MKKFILTLVLILTAGSVLAASPKPDNTVRLAIKKYNAQNYTGCIQDLEKYTKNKKTGLAYYYLAMSYAQAGKQEEALESYTQAIDYAEKEKNTFLKSYATLGMKKIEKPYAFQSNDEFDEVYGVIQRKTTIPAAVRDDLKTKHLEYLRNQINAGVEPKF